MSTRPMLAALACLLAVGPAGAAAHGREAHEHGHAVLAIAVEGRQMSLELAAPGMDLVGFEHPASTDGQRAAIEQARGALADPLALFVLPAAAGCRVAAAEVTHADGADGHGGFAATYLIDCSDPVRLDGVAFAWFDRFPGSEAVEVTLLTAQGQSRHEMTREAPWLALPPGP